MITHHERAATKKRAAEPHHGKNFVRDAHPRSRFGRNQRLCWFLDMCRKQVENLPPADLDARAAIAERGGDSSDARMLRFFAPEGALFFDLWRPFTREAYRLPAEASDACADEILAAWLRDCRVTTLGDPKRRIPNDDKPPKRISDSLIFGCRWSQSDGKRTVDDTVIAMNEGIPHGMERRGIKRHTVGRHLHDAEQHILTYRDPNERIIACAANIRTWRVADRFHSRCDAERLSDADISALVNSGHVFEWLDEDPGDDDLRLVAEIAALTISIRHLADRKRAC